MLDGSDDAAALAACCCWDCWADEVLGCVEAEVVGMLDGGRQNSSKRSAWEEERRWM